MTSEHEIRQAIVEQIQVDQVDVSEAKRFIIANFDPLTKKILDGYMTQLSIQSQTEYQLSRSDTAETQAIDIAKFLSAQIVFGEAIFGLVHSGMLLPTHTDPLQLRTSITYYMPMPSGGGHSTTIEFEEYTMFVPKQIMQAHSKFLNEKSQISDPDLFRSTIKSVNIHPDVEESIILAIQCLRHDLYLPCVVMIARASEGAWIEMGQSLLEFIPEQAPIREQQRAKLMETVTGRRQSIAAKMDTIADLYGKKDIFNQIYKKSDCSPDQLREILSWSNVVRNYRNAIHPGSEKSQKLSYSVAATLLLGAAQNLKAVYAIRDAANALGD